MRGGQERREGKLPDWLRPGPVTTATDRALEQSSPVLDASWRQWERLRAWDRRSAFVVDKEGIIRYAEVLETATDLPDFSAIQKTLESIK